MSSENESGISLHTILKDFVSDLLLTFPELNTNLHEGLARIGRGETEGDSVDEVINFCKETYPKRFIDILYENNEIFAENNVELLPGINFSVLWQQNISENTKGIMWKYMQLILFNIVTNGNNTDSFGDAAKLFEVINETDFKNKMTETIQQMEDLFKNKECSGINVDELPKAEDVHAQLHSMLDGNLGKIAREIAEETAQEVNMDMDESATVEDVFKKVFKNPGKLMSLVKSVGDKLDTKLKDGTIKEEELLNEANELMGKMNGVMPGLGNIGNLLSGLNGGAGRRTMNMAAAQMQSQMQANRSRSRLQNKLEKRRAQAAQAAEANNNQQNNEVPLSQVASNANVVERNSNPKRKKKKKHNKK